MTTQATATPAAHLLGWDCVELWVGNALAMTGFLTGAFGFTCTAYAGPETGVRTKASYVLKQGEIRFVVSGALDAGHRRSPSACGDTATVCTTSPSCRRRRRGLDATAIRRGRRAPMRTPCRRRPTTPARCGSRRSRPTATLCIPSSAAQPLPRRPPRTRLHGRQPAQCDGARARLSLTRIDHVVGTSNRQARRLGWLLRNGDGLHTAAALRRRSDLNGVLGADFDRRVGRLEDLMPINEPAEGLKRRARSRSTSSEYDGPGVQHLALRTRGMVATVDALRQRACASWTCPTSITTSAANGWPVAACQAGDAAAGCRSSPTTAVEGSLCRNLRETDRRPPGRVLRG